MRSETLFVSGKSVTLVHARRPSNMRLAIIVTATAGTALRPPATEMITLIILRGLALPLSLELARGEK